MQVVEIIPAEPPTRWDAVFPPYGCAANLSIRETVLDTHQEGGRKETVAGGKVARKEGGRYPSSPSPPRGEVGEQGSGDEAARDGNGRRAASPPEASPGIVESKLESARLATNTSGAAAPWSGPLVPVKPMPLPYRAKIDFPGHRQR
ncbi:hypothetical protein KM043_002946 [Ampulex compressa]|nr:hypothetical protein KM043_002946 [Ampulex compressa]